MDGLMKRYLDRITSKPNVVVISSATGQASAGREAAFNYRTLRDNVQYRSVCRWIWRLHAAAVGRCELIRSRSEDDSETDAMTRRRSAGRDKSLTSFDFLRRSL